MIPIFPIPNFFLDLVQKKSSSNRHGYENQAVEKAAASEIKRIINGSEVTLEGTYQGQPIRIRIIGGTAQEPGSE